MIRGVVNDHREGIIRLRVRGPAGIELVVTRSLIPVSLVLDVANDDRFRIGLVRQSGSSGEIADGSIRQFDVYEAEVE